LARIGRGMVWDAEQQQGVEREGVIVIVIVIEVEGRRQHDDAAMFAAGFGSAGVMQTLNFRCTLDGVSITGV